MVNESTKENILERPIVNLPYGEFNSLCRLHLLNKRCNLCVQEK